jgi:uncharacterized protein involved in outer membrane biogenesis
MKKGLLIIGSILLILLVGVFLFLGPIVKVAVEKAVPDLLGAPVQIEKVRIYPLAGSVHIKGLVIGNPEGFKTPSAMELGELRIDIKMLSLFTDTIIVKTVHIDAPQITYERGLSASNLSTLQDNVAPPKKPKGEQPVEAAPEKEASSKPAKKVVIEDFLMENGSVNVSMTLAGGNKLEVPLAAIHMEDIGKESDGASIGEVINEVLDSIIASAGSAATATGDMVGGAVKGVKGAGSSAVDGVTKGFGKLFGGKD